jgi:metallo-beta-lactamase family protein
LRTVSGDGLKKWPETVGIFGERFTVKADIVTLNSMSALADYNDLCQYLSCQDNNDISRIFIVHGEPEV